MKTEREKVRAYIEKYPEYKVSDIQRVIKKGYIYTAKLLEEMKTERACPACGGEGSIPVMETDRHTYLNISCPECGGSGKKERETGE